MTVWLGALALVALVLALILPVVLRARAGPSQRASHDLRVYRAQLDEIEQDQAQGTIDDAAAASARFELERRMLRTAREGEEDGESGKAEEAGEAGGAPPRSLRGLAIALTLLAPLVALAIYLHDGAPDLPGQPFALRDRPPPSLAEAGLAALRAAVNADPGDLEALLRLGRAQIGQGETQAAVATFRRAADVAKASPDVLATLGEALIYDADGTVTQEAQDVLAAALAQDPVEPRARYYLGLAAYQSGRSEEALARWGALLGDAPEGAPWAANIATRIRQVAAETGRDPGPYLAMAARSGAARLGAGPGGAEGPPVEALAAMSPEEREAAVRTMVANLAQRLDTQGGAPAEWMRLGRSYSVLGEEEKAVAAFAQAATLAPDDAEAQLAFGIALVRAAPEPAALPERVAKQMALVLALDPESEEALWFAGVMAAQAGDKATARRHWEKLASLLPPDGRQFEIVQRGLAALEAP